MASPSFLRHGRSLDETDATNEATNESTNEADSTSTSSSSSSSTCPPCPACDASHSSLNAALTNTTSNTPTQIKLRFLVTERSFARLQIMLQQMADDYARKLGYDSPEITVVGLPTLAEVEREVKFDVKSGASQFDGYIITPLWIGELASGLFEITDFIKEYSNEEPTYWTDILLFYREVISSYDNNLYLFPFDGDVISMFYRRDLLEEFGKDVPRTWEEYHELARFFHGKTHGIRDEETGEIVKNVTLSGSCIGRTPQCGGPYWAQTVLATMTQVKGTYEGSLLSPKDISPLLGEAMEETLRLHGAQTLFGVTTDAPISGTKNEFDGCVDVHVDAMNEGECVLTYNWGNSFSGHVREGSVVRGKLGVAPTPGSYQVLDRTTGKLVECTPQRCPHAVLDERNGRYINLAPYGAYGGFSGAVSGSVSPEHQEAAAKFFAFATSAKKAIKYVIPDADNSEANPVPTGMDPYAKSMLDVEEWTSRGFDVKSTEEYKYAIESQLGSENVVIDLRMPMAAEFYDTLDRVITRYCNDTKWDAFEYGGLEEGDEVGREARRREIRKEMTEELEQQWRQIVVDYDSAEDRQPGALLELYQRDKGVYVPPKNTFNIYNDNDAASISSGVIIVIVLCLTAVIAISIYAISQFVKRNEKRKREEQWYVNSSDIVDTKEVIGRGSFGVVTKGFLRGTPVALKHAKGWEPNIVKEVAGASGVNGGTSVEEAVIVEGVNGGKNDLVLNDTNDEDAIDNNSVTGGPRRTSVASSLSDSKDGNGNHPPPLRQQDSLSGKEIQMNNDVEIEDSTIGGTLLTEPSTFNNNGIGGLFPFRRKPKKKPADDSLRAELLLLVKLRHPNIVQTFGASQDLDQKRLVLILQFMENGPIRNVLKDPHGVAGTAGMALEIQWALQVARGVNFLHTVPPPAGPMVHADLKSSNVLLDGSYNANISDFGLATKTMGGLWGAIRRNAKGNNPRGSILWMAPEVLNGGDPTPESDVYSYSMFLVELMTRDRPYGVKAMEVKEVRESNEGGEMGGEVVNGGKVRVCKRFSDITLDTEYDRKPFGESMRLDSVISEVDENEANDEQDKVVAFAAEDNQIIVKKTENHNSGTSGSTAATSQSSTTALLSATTSRSVRMSQRVSFSDTVDNIPEPPNPEAAHADPTDPHKLKPGTRGFYALINNQLLTRDDIIHRVKDLSLDPPFRPTLPENAPQILVDICTECWQKNPKRRPTMKEVEDRLSAACNETMTKKLMMRGSVFDSILPPDVQDKLAKGENVPPKTHDDVTVLFSDIVGFTSTSSALTAEEVGDMIFRLFTKFDALCKTHGVKKLDVVGDAFIGVVGVPTKLNDHAIRAAKFALAAIEEAKHTIICPSKPHLGYVRVRFGLASGSAVATVIGSREHPKYTLFGDAVNTASRMESTSLPNRVQVTKETADLIQEGDGGGTIDVVSRGMVEVKGKGQMETFFLERC